tara:strand:- start:1136 stop:1336 length:201 start_codon:yes stop_codon:yes gene_type:complete
MSSAAIKIIDSLLVINEALVTVDQVSELYKRVVAGDVPTEAEIDAKLKRNVSFAEAELERIKNDNR